MSDEFVYFDHNATTSLDPQVLEAMLPWLAGQHGNTLSVHRAGRAAREAVEAARDQVASLLGADSLEVVFTASGTEANNAVMFSVGLEHEHRGRLVIATLEHPSIRAAAERLEAQGMEVVRVPPGRDGVVPAEAVVAALDDSTRLVCMMLAHNELGTLQPVAEVAAVCRDRGIPVLCDAVQAVGKVPVRVKDLGVDFLTLGGHKFHGPLGVAALWIRSGTELAPLLVGGGQERRRRASTLNVPAIVGLGVASARAGAGLPERYRHLAALRDQFEAGLGEIGDTVVHGATAARLPNTSLVSFVGAEAQALMIRLDLAGFGVSTGSACSSGAVEPNKTLLAMGASQAEAVSALRVSFGVPNTPEEVAAFLAALESVVPDLRSAVPAGRASG
ncbi:MAG: cysteine desulfurase family protein [Acidobacteriota bacterium]